jgi:hypothetical protein
MWEVLVAGDGVGPEVGRAELAVILIFSHSMLPGGALFRVDTVRLKSDRAAAGDAHAP